MSPILASSFSEYEPVSALSNSAGAERSHIQYSSVSQQEQEDGPLINSLKIDLKGFLNVMSNLKDLVFNVLYLGHHENGFK